MSYTLLGRDIQTAAASLSKEEQHTRELPRVPCIFCGETIAHFNDGGEGWCVGAVVDGKALSFLYCNQPACEQAARFDHEIWRCGCESDYLENIGALCTGCRRSRLDALPWDYDLEADDTHRLTVEGLRAKTLDDVYGLLPTEQLQLNEVVPYVDLVGTLASTGSIFQSPECTQLRVDHIANLPLESLIALRRILTQHWKDRHVSPPSRVRPAPVGGRSRRTRRV